MDGTGQTLSFSDIVEINRRLIRRSGGHFREEVDNLLNPGSLEYVLHTIQGSFLGHDPYPTLFSKAAAIAWFVIDGHVFYDGNKRTGMDSCYVFLRFNGYEMRIDYEVVEMALAVAQQTVEFDTFVRWIEVRTRKLE